MTKDEKPEQKGENKGKLPLPVAWMTTILGVPSALLAGIKWHSLTSHPFLATAIAAPLILTLTVSAIARELWRRKYKELVIESIDRRLEWRISRFERRYREHLASELRLIDLKGLAIRGFFTPELDDVYVDVSLMPRDPGQVPESDLDESTPMDDRRRSINEFICQPKPAVLAILGAPGSGKTTLLRHTAREMSHNKANHFKRNRKNRTIPVLLYLRDHVRALTSETPPPLDALLTSALDKYGIVVPKGWFEQRIRDGKCIVLLDGLDEVGRQEDRQAVSEWIGIQIRRYSKNDFVVTARPGGYKTAPIDGAISLQTRKFSKEKVSRFVHNWYFAVERHGGAPDEVEHKRVAREEADDLLQRLGETPALDQLTVNPLLLTMICNVHRYRGALPGSRADLYGQICEVLLWRRQEAKKLAVEPRSNQRSTLMRILAFEMMRRRVSALSKPDAVDALRAAVRRVSKTITAEEVLADAGSNGMLIERENGLYAFSHLTFQEYLAAMHILERGPLDKLVAAVDDQWWRECTLLYVANADAGPIVRACLKRNSVSSLSLAFDCAEEANELAEDLRDRLETLRSEGLSDREEYERYRLMVAVTVLRHLRRLTRLADGSRVCRRGVTQEVFDFFLQDMAAHGSIHTPAASQHLELESKKGDLVAGMRGSDSITFARWVNDLAGSELSFGLPTRSDVEDPAFRDILRREGYSALSIWVAASAEGEAVELWTPPGTSSPLAIRSELVRQRLEHDFRHLAEMLTFLVLTRVDIIATLLANTLEDVRHESRRDFRRENKLAFARDLAIKTSDLARKRARVCASNLDQIVVHFFDVDKIKQLVLNSNLNKIFQEHFTESIVVAIRRARDLNRALGSWEQRFFYRPASGERDLLFARTLNRALEQTVEVACLLDSAFAVDVIRDDYIGRLLDPESSDGNTHDILLDLPGVLDTAIGRTLDLATGVGRILSEGLAELFSRRGLTERGVSERDLQVFFSTQLQLKSGMRNDALTYEVALDEVERLVDDAVADLRAAVVDAPSADWTRGAAERFGILVKSVWSREKPLTAKTATAVRIAAFCLAGEVEDLADSFHSIAAAVTWLERRYNGEDQPMEVIYLKTVTD